MAYAADSSFLSRRGLVFLVIVAVHVGLWWVLDSGLSHTVVQKVFGPIVTDIIEEPQTQEEEPPPPPPKIETPPPFVPPPEVAIQLPSEAPPATAITTATTARPVAPPPVAAPPKVAGTKPKTDPKRPLTRPEYPAQSLRLGEQGTVTLDLYVLENGRVGDARVAASSGFPRLDEAAVKEAKRNWRLTPGTENGKPVAMWHQFKMTFNIEDAKR